MIDKTMTAPRRRRKLCPVLSRRGFFAAAAELSVVATGVLTSIIPATQAATTEQIVNDRHTGLAIHGFDPVAYFVGGTAALGNDEFEHTFGGVAWRFCNEGNLAAFIADPELYIRSSAATTRSPSPVGWRSPATPGFGSMSEERALSLLCAGGAGCLCQRREAPVYNCR